MTRETAECDCCGEMVPKAQIAFIAAEDCSAGCDAYACCKCRGANPEDFEDEDDEEYDFTCGRCGGSGGGPEHWRCPACLGSGEDRRAKMAYFDSLRDD